MDNSNEKGDKITKVLAACGHGSRRSCEELIDMLRVTINGTVAERGDRVRQGDEVRLDNSKIRIPQMQYYKIYKPKGYLCNASPDGRALHVDSLMPKIKTRLFAVGRLDKDFEGLLIYTNDGELCNRLTHPRYQCPKRYEVRINGSVPMADIEKISKGIFLSEGKTAPIDIVLKKQSPQRTLVVMEIRESRRRLIPRVFAHLDHHVDKVKRISVGSIKLQGLKVGQAVRMSSEEVNDLKKAAFGAEAKFVNKKKITRFNPQHVTKKSSKKTTKSQKTKKKSVKKVTKRKGKK